MWAVEHIVSKCCGSGNLVHEAVAHRAQEESGSSHSERGISNPKAVAVAAALRSSSRGSKDSGGRVVASGRGSDHSGGCGRCKERSKCYSELKPQ